MVSPRSKEVSSIDIQRKYNMSTTELKQVQFDKMNYRYNVEVKCQQKCIHDDLSLLQNTPKYKKKF